MAVITGGTVIEGGPPQELSGAAAPVDGTDEVQVLTITADSGTYKVGFDGWYTTALAYGANSAAVQTAMRLLPSINGANVTVTGDAPHTITFVAGLGKMAHALCTTNVDALYNSSPTKGTAIVTISVEGVTATGRGCATGTRYTRTSSGVNYTNTGTALAPAWTAQADTLGVSYLGSVTPGTIAASKAAIVDSNKDAAAFRTVGVVNLDAGSSGVAGTVDVFPTTAARGKLALTAANSAGDTTTTIVNASQSGGRTYTIPDAGGATASFVMTEGAQTVNGTKTVPALVTTNLDAGASGTAGTVDVFPTTGSKGKLAISVTDQAGDTTVSLIAGAMAAARVLTIADPLADADVLTGKMAAVARTASADGSGNGTIAAAGLLQFLAVTSTSATDQIILPAPTPGRIVILYVGATGFKLKSSAPGTVAINGGTGAAAVSAVSANMMAVAICTSATTWHSFTITAATLAALPAAS